MTTIALDDPQSQALLTRASKLLNLPYIASPKQLIFHMDTEHVGMSKPVLYGGAMGGGKSAAICAEAIRECMEIPNNRVLMARRELVTFKRTTLQTLFQFLPKEVLHRPSAQLFLFPNNSQLHYSGLGRDRDRSKLQSSEWGAIFMDEAHEIEYTTFLMASTRLRWRPADDVNRLKMRLTANPEPGWLKEHFVEQPDEGYHYISALPIDNPFLPKDYVTDMKKQLPPDWYRAYIMGDWNAMVPIDVVLKSTLLTEAIKRHTQAGNAAIWGVDVSRFGDDMTVIARRRGFKFDFVDQWHHKSVDETVDQIVGHYALADIKPDAINVDDDGVGGGVTDGLRRAQNEGRLGAVQINAVIAQASPGDSEIAKHYANLKAYLWFSMKRLLESGEPVDLPAPDEEQDARGDLEAHRYEIRGGKAFVEPKKLVKSRLGRSPDHGDAIILTMYERAQDYVAYMTEEERIRLSLEGMSEQARAAALERIEQRKSDMRKLANFSRFAGVNFVNKHDPTDVGY